MTAVSSGKARRREGSDPEGRMPLTEHLRELRIRLVRSMVAVLVCALVAAYFYNQLFHLIIAPFYTAAKSYPDAKLNFTGIGDPFSYALKVCATAGIIAASPVWLWNLWGFVAPGLHRREKQYGIAFVATSVPLFLGGVALAYYFLPKGFGLLIGFNPAPDKVANIVGLDVYFAFVIRMFVIFGFSFVMPVFLVALNLAGLVSGRQLLKSWRPVTMGAFVFSAIATPTPDPWTMTALATPLLALYYVAAGLSLLTDRRRRRAPIDGLNYDAMDDDEASPLDHRPEGLDDGPGRVDDE